jgi:hypothetical protein
VHHSNYYSELTLIKDIEKAGFKYIKSVREIFGGEIFSAKKSDKLKFRILEAISKLFHKEIVCIIIAQAK